MIATCFSSACSNNMKYFWQDTGTISIPMLVEGAEGVSVLFKPICVKLPAVRKVYSVGFSTPKSLQF